MTGANDGMIEPLIDLQRLAAGIRWRRRLWGTLALLGLVGGVLAAVVTAGAEASAQIYVLHETEQSGDAEATTKTDLALLKSTSVAAEAIAREPVDEAPEDYVDEYTGAVVAANVLRVTAPGRDDAEAVARASALADAFVTVYTRQSDDRARKQVEALNERRTAVLRDLAGLRLGRDPDPAGRAQREYSLNAELSAVEQLAVQAEIGTPQIAAGTMVIDGARVTSRPSVVGAVIYGLVGLLAGLGVGLGLAAVMTVVRDRPVLRRDIGAHLGASVIAQVGAPATGGWRLLRRGRRRREESERVGAIMARVVRCGTGPLSVLELGSGRAAPELVRAMAAELATDSPVEILDDLPDSESVEALGIDTDTVRIIDGTDFPSVTSSAEQAGVRRLGVGTVRPGTSWTDLRRLGDETILVVRAGSAEASWMHTVARQLADEGIAVVGVVVVHPDPRDRSDGTLWDPLHTAVRGRVAARARRDADATEAAVESPTLQLRKPPSAHIVLDGNGHTNGKGHANGDAHPVGNGHPDDNGHAATGDGTAEDAGPDTSAAAPNGRRGSRAGRRRRATARAGRGPNGAEGRENGTAPPRPDGDN